MMRTYFSSLVEASIDNTLRYLADQKECNNSCYNIKNSKPFKQLIEVVHSQGYRI